MHNSRLTRQEIKLLASSFHFFDLCNKVYPPNPHLFKGQNNTQNLVTSTILILTPSLHLLTPLSPPLPPLLRLRPFPPQPNRDLLPHHPILKQHPNIRSPRHNLLPKRLAHRPPLIPLRNHIPSLVPRPRDLRLRCSERGAQVNVDRDVGVGTGAHLSAI